MGQTELSLQDVLQLDADLYVAEHTCSERDNIAFWFFQTAEKGDAIEEPMTHWDAFSEVDLMETFIGPGGVNSINSNFAALELENAGGRNRHWLNYTITGGVRQHITMWQDVENAASCERERNRASMFTWWVSYDEPLPVVSIYVAHCARLCHGEAGEVAARALQLGHISLGDPGLRAGCIGCEGRYQIGVTKKAP